MRFESEQGGQLGGNLLVAHPDLRDPNFRRTVVYLAAHDEHGTLGFVLNRPTGSKVGDFIDPSEAWKGLSDIPVFQGGPVALDRLIIAAFKWEPENQAIHWQAATEHAEISDFAGAENTIIRAFVGHSGWAGGQLETELQMKSWIVKAPVKGILKNDGADAIWRRIVGEISPWMKLQAAAPDDPSLN